MAREAATQVYMDSLRASEADLKAAIEMLAEAEEAHGPHSRRQSQRYFFHMRVPLDITLQQPGGTVGRFRVIPHNISDTGLGFLHGAYVHGGTPCQMILTKISGARAAALGRTVHATCLRGRVHLVGVKFDLRINALDFVEPDKDTEKRVACDPQQVIKVAKELGELVLSNATMSVLREKYKQLGEALFQTM